MLIVTPNAKKAGHLAQACGHENDFAHCRDGEPNANDVLAIIEAADARTVVIGPGVKPLLAQSLATAIVDEHPFMGIVLYTSDDSAEIRAAFRAGASDVATPGMMPDEVASIVEETKNHMAQRRLAEPVAEGNRSEESRMITVVSPRGGVGRTLIATGLAVTLERRFPGDVVMVDLDLQCGDVAPMLGLNPSMSISSLTGRNADLNTSDVKAILTQDVEGLHVLAAPHSLAAAIKVGPELVTVLLRLLAASFRYVVIDTGTCIAETTLSALDQTTDLMLVCAPDVPSVRALGRAADALDELRIINPRRHLVINKASDRYGMPLRDIEAVSGMSPRGQLPAAKEIAMSLNRGTPFHEAFHPRSTVAKALEAITDEIVPSPSKAGRGRRWRRR